MRPRGPHEETKKLQKGEKKIKRENILKSKLKSRLKAAEDRIETKPKTGMKIECQTAEAMLQQVKNKA
ncbi:MAG: hypothetical protein LBT40_12950 [Deltaproteobacteria bacterium]|jgi:ribosomal protein S20|nr:hypothetical protein [Deltaproteobacteria bacterium]